MRQFCAKLWSMRLSHWYEWLLEAPTATKLLVCALAAPVFGDGK